MRNLWEKLSAGMAALTLATACGPSFSTTTTQSKIDSVEIPQTAIENQNKIGFCWAYAIVGLVESDYKLRTGSDIQLSEEALGFYRMLEGIYFWTQNLSGQELVEQIKTDSFQGWVLTDKTLPDTFKLVQKYGVIPESAWKVKFENELVVDRMVQTIQKQVLQLILQNPNPRSITRDQILNSALLAPGAWASQPPTNFSLDGKSYTPQTYLTEIGFNPSNYKSLVSNLPSDVDTMIAAAKQALLRGVSVPLGFPVNFDRLQGDMFKGAGTDLSVPENFYRDGGHAVLIDDFVNVGGKAGALPLDQLMVEFLKPSKDLDYFIVKNSWGKDAKTNEAGVVIEGSETGYYRIDLAYLQGSANMASRPEYKGMLEVVVPTDIALFPFTQSPQVNSKVVLPGPN
jgi:hypothetical protein